MTLFYLGPCVRVTHEVFEVRCPSYQSFAIRDLSHVHAASTKDATYTQHRKHNQFGEPIRSSSPLGRGAAVTSGAAAAAAVAAWPIFGHPAAPVTALAVLALAGAVSLACRAPRRVQELRAIYRGELVCLFRTVDRLTFGQVSRALLRVLERLDEARQAAA